MKKGLIMRQAFTLTKFKAGGHKVKLIFPETWQADGLFLQLQKNKKQLSRWLPWVKNINSPQKEAAALQSMQAKIAQKKGLYLVLLIEGQEAGMIDLHQLNSASGEVGYWLAADYQHLGIMTKCVKELTAYAFKQLKLQYLLLRTAPDNVASQNVSKRCGFHFVKLDDKKRKVFRLDR